MGEVSRTWREKQPGQTCAGPEPAKAAAELGAQLGRRNWSKRSGTLEDGAGVDWSGSDLNGCGFAMADCRRKPGCWR
jgi:uncharacterized protein YjbI with pentapeptide repeats